MADPEIVRLNIRHYRALLQLDRPPAKHRAVAAALAEAERELAAALALRDGERRPDARAVWVIEMIRNAARRFRDEAADTANARARQKLAQQALDLAQAAESLNRMLKSRS
jgi:hypothetical protein